MKVIFLKDIPKVGKKFETKNISDGYALNFLIPKGLAQVATDSAIKNLAVQQAKAQDEFRVQEDLLIKNLKEIDGAIVTMTEKANEKGHLFAGIHKAEIIPAITEQTRVVIHPDFMVLDKPIKEVGEHKIDLLVKDKKASFTLVVKALEE